MSERVRVLFIEGAGRSGSTVLGNLLGSVPGAASFGEVRHVWRRGVVGNWSCGCGSSFGTCDFWRTVMSRAFSDVRHLDLDTILQSERSLLRLRNSPRSLRWSRHDEALRHSHACYVGALRRLYRALWEVSGTDFIIDSSKTPTYRALLGTIDEIDLRVVHLTRDPRGTAYSWMNPKPSPERGTGGMMDSIGPAESAFLWAWWNRLADALSESRPDIPRVRVTYEDLMTSPQPTLRVVLEQLAPELLKRPIPMAGATATLVASHTVSGNPSRMRIGEVTLRLDDRWHQGLGVKDETIVRMIGGRMMRRYGYGPRHRESNR